MDWFRVRFTITLMIDVEDSIMRITLSFAGFNLQELIQWLPPLFIPIHIDLLSEINSPALAQGHPLCCSEVLPVF